VTALAWRDVGYAYPDAAPALHDVDLEVTAGDVVLVAGPSGSGGGSPPYVISSISSTVFSAATDSNWHDVPGASVSFSVAAASPVSLTWNFAVPVGGLVFMRLALDGAPLAGSQAFIMGTSFMTGAYQATASGGAHVISLQYQTDSAFSYDPSVPWESAVLQALVFDQ